MEFILVACLAQHAYFYYVRFRVFRLISGKLCYVPEKLQQYSSLDRQKRRSERRNARSKPQRGGGVT